ncbi:Hypothetical protein PFCIRM134_08805 [Propionibacterium freudenreichii]|nr:Hypothetical protein PFCIRM134_08805 [Propionibacterium freudenreichii]
MVLLAIVNLAAAVLLIAMGVLGQRHALPRNGWAGIRTATTLTNDDTWDAAHVAAAPTFVIGGLVQLLLAATALVLAGNDDLNGARVAIVFTVVWLVTLTGAVAMAAVVGVRAATVVLVRQQRHLVAVGAHGRSASASDEVLGAEPPGEWISRDPARTVAAIVVALVPAALMMVLRASVFADLPAKVPQHWGLSGPPDAWVSSNIAFWLGFVAASVLGIAAISVLLVARTARARRGYYSLFTILAFVASAAWLASALYGVGVAIGGWQSGLIIAAAAVLGLVARYIVPDA